MDIREVSNNSITSSSTRGCLKKKQMAYLLTTYYIIAYVVKLSFYKEGNIF